jgi:glycosyltransferase involved in cell wall biosynthesis
MNIPLFTVIIPTFNRAELLREAIQSVLDQTYKDFELIVVDDHSTDNTQQIKDSIQDNRMKYIFNDHLKGNSGARNAGIFRAKGKWIAFLDDDDTWFPRKLELVYNKICNIDNSVGLIYTGFAYYDFALKQQISIHIPEKKGWIQKDLLFDNYIGTPSAVTVRADILVKEEGFDERINYCEDGELYVRIAELAKIEYIKDTLTNYRISNKDKLSLNNDNKLKSFDLIWKKHKGIIDKYPRLRHRAASRVLRFAVKERSIKHMYEALPWTVAGLFLDIHNVIHIIKMILSDLFKRDDRFGKKS